MSKSFSNNSRSFIHESLLNLNIETIITNKIIGNVSISKMDILNSNITKDFFGIKMIENVNFAFDSINIINNSMQ